MYSSLHTHDMYSLLDGFGTPEEMLQRAKEIGLKALAITNHGNEYSWVYYDKLKAKYPEIKIIYGVELYEVFDTSIKDSRDKRFHLLALAMNEKGRIALNKIITKSNLENFYYKPRVQISDIEPYADDLIITSACLASKIAKENDYLKCVDYVREYKKAFPHFYLEMQSHSTPEQWEYNKKILQLSEDTNTSFIITTDAHAATKEDLYYQGRHVQIAHDSETMSESYDGCYLQSEGEIYQILSDNIGEENVKIGLRNTNILADMCEEVCMPFQSPQLPTYPLPDGFNSNYEYLKYLIEEGWAARGFDKLSVDQQKIYRDRINYELDIIHKMNFDGYFLIVQDFIKFAKKQGIKIGAGRGSCSGSLICDIIEITNINPMKYGLIFERFLNPERISMPDSDTDVADRTTIINYLINKYGENRVCQIINFSFITPTVAIKDVGKILGFKYGEMDKLAKKFSYETFNECIEHNRDYIDNHPEYAELLQIASKLSGRVKTVSAHAGGVGIVDTDITDYMAMKLGSKGEHVISVDKRVIEEIGIIKFDILGVQTLSLVQEIQKDLRLSDWELDINNPEFEFNQSSYDLLKSTKTNGVFQVESAGMKDLLGRLSVNNMEELSAVLALYRPDSMPALEEFISCKHDPSLVSYIHPDMKPILESTYGCMIYQEQLMDIVRKFGGRSYGGADLFRKAIGKKNKELVQSESKKLYQEIIDNGYSAEIAKTISDDLAEKGGYLFNKSHSYSYAILCLQTAYLKANYPVYFFKALLNLNKSKPGALNKYILDARDFNVEILTPHVNKSEMNFSVYDNKVLFGLSAIAGLGENVANEIISEREDNGKFKNLNDLLARVSLTKSQVVALIKSGAIPTKDKKKCMIKYLMSMYDGDKTEFKPVKALPSYTELVAKYDIDIEQYRIGDGKYAYDKAKLLDVYNDIKHQLFEERQQKKRNDYITSCEKYLADEQFWEFHALQIFINNNPFEQAYKFITRQFDDVAVDDYCMVVGIISKVQKKKDKNKNQFAFINIYSSFGLIEGTVWSSTYKEYEGLIRKGQQIAIRGRKCGDENIIVENIKSYDQWLIDRKLKGK